MYGCILKLSLIRLQALRVKEPLRSFNGIHTHFAWCLQRPLQTVLKVFLDSQLVWERVTYDMPFAQDGKFMFFNRTEVDPSLTGLPKEFAKEHFEHDLVFLINLVDSTNQESVLSLLLLADNAQAPFVAVFPLEELLSVFNSAPSPVYPALTQGEPLYKAPRLLNTNTHPSHLSPHPLTTYNTIQPYFFHHEPARLHSSGVKSPPQQLAFPPK